jgi:hypothetical protein
VWLCCCPAVPLSLSERTRAVTRRPSAWWFCSSAVRLHAALQGCVPREEAKPARTSSHAPTPPPLVTARVAIGPLPHGGLPPGSPCFSVSGNPRRAEPQFPVAGFTLVGAGRQGRGQPLRRGWLDRECRANGAGSGGGRSGRAQSTRVQPGDWPGPTCRMQRRSDHRQSGAAPLSARLRTPPLLAAGSHGRLRASLARAEALRWDQTRGAGSRPSPLAALGLVQVPVPWDTPGIVPEPSTYKRERGGMGVENCWTARR